MWNDTRQENSASAKCSFCGKGRAQINRLTAGPGGIYICNECVDIYREHITNMEGASVTMENISKVCSTCETRVPASHHYCHNCGSQFTQET